MAYLEIGLVLLGLIGLLASLKPLIKIASLNSEHGRAWGILLILVGFFILGYGLFAVRLASAEPGLTERLLSLILFGGSIFVVLVCRLSKQTMQELDDTVSTLEQQGAQIQYQSLHDLLTGLPNRNQLADFLDECLNDSTSRPLALFCINVNDFKQINDTFGYYNGDRVLKAIAEGLRAETPNQACVARISADEFMVGCPDFDHKQADALGKRLIHRFNGRLAIGQDLEVPLSLAQGVTLAPEHGVNRETLVRRSDIAMQSAKSGRLAMAFYQFGQEEAYLGRIDILSDLRRAVDQEALKLYFQPQINMATGSVLGMEALLRWAHPIRGLIPPDNFIPLAEQSGDIEWITHWVVEHAIREARRWRDQGLNLSLSLNISASDLSRSGLSERLTHSLSECCMTAPEITLEITESAFMADQRQSVGQLMRLRRQGFQIAIDDFGTGYSSLSQLRDLPVNALKIDKSFLLLMQTRPENSRIVRSIIELGHNLDLLVTAEGVETEAMYQQLQAAGCDHCQGYWLSRPMPADEVAHWYHAHQPARLKARN